LIRLVSGSLFAGLKFGFAMNTSSVDRCLGVRMTSGNGRGNRTLKHTRKQQARNRIATVPGLLCGNKDQN
ncbi:hypothetical protein, partial [Psychrobacter sp. GW64-MNA-CIBAN-0177]|uniref:hypothetical protein n=1 Tax=Psychrobacter sp. GW64-MNA-CIBAN-0177 TaxID=3140449 RepID=UPI003324A451